MLYTLHGSRRVSTQRLPDESAGIFTRDNRWITVTRNHGKPVASLLVIQRLDTPQEPTTTHINLQRGAEPIGVTQDQQLLTIADPAVFLYPNADCAPQFEYYLTRLDRPGTPDRQVTLRRPPYNFEGDETALSPDGGRIAACIHFCEIMPGPRWFQDLVDRFGPTTQIKTITCIWVNRVDGTDGYEVGRLPNNSDDENPHALHWTPDGKHISYVYHNALYTVEAD